MGGASSGAIAALSIFCIFFFLFGLYALCKAEGYHRRWKKKLAFMRFRPRSSGRTSDTGSSVAAESESESDVMRIGATPSPQSAGRYDGGAEIMTPPLSDEEEEKEEQGSALLLEEGIRSDIALPTRGSSLWELPNKSVDDRKQKARDYLLAKAQPSPAVATPANPFSKPEPLEEEMDEEEIPTSPDPPPPLGSLKSTAGNDWSSTSNNTPSALSQARAAQIRPAPGTWVKCLHYTDGPYKPTPRSVGTLAPKNTATSPAGLAKLSDEEINSIPPHTDGYHYYKLECEAAPGLLNNTVFVRTTRAFVDAEPAFGWGGAGEYSSSSGTYGGGYEVSHTSHAYTETRIQWEK